MPLYEYKCDLCGETFDVIQKFSDSPLTVHEGCGGKVERLISPSALHFKGSGWYVTDYGRGKSGGKGSSPVKSQPEKSAPAPASEVKPASESKPAPATSGK